MFFKGTVTQLISGKSRAGIQIFRHPAEVSHLAPLVCSLCVARECHGNTDLRVSESEEEGSALPLTACPWEGCTTSLWLI